MVRNLEEIGFLREEMVDVCLIADHNLYTYNDTAKKTLRKWGITFDTVPYELNRTEILGRDLSDSIMCLYGYYPLMTTAGCVHRNAAGCDKKPTLHFLSDRYHAQFPVQNDCNECMNTIYNSLPTMLFSARKELMAQGLDHFLLCVHIESEEEIRKICDVYEAYLQGDGMPPKDCNMKFTNGHYKRGVL